MSITLLAVLELLFTSFVFCFIPCMFMHSFKAFRENNLKTFNLCVQTFFTEWDANAIANQCSKKPHKFILNSFADSGKFYIYNYIIIMHYCSLLFFCCSFILLTCILRVILHSNTSLFPFALPGPVPRRGCWVDPSKASRPRSAPSSVSSIMSGKSAGPMCQLHNLVATMQNNNCIIFKLQ